MELFATSTAEAHSNRQEMLFWVSIAAASSSIADLKSFGFDLHRQDAVGKLLDVPVGLGQSLGQPVGSLSKPHQLCFFEQPGHLPCCCFSWHLIQEFDQRAGEQSQAGQLLSGSVMQFLAYASLLFRGDFQHLFLELFPFGDVALGGCHADRPATFVAIRR